MSSRTDRFKTNNAMNKDETVGPYGPLFLGQKSQFRRLEDSLKTYVPTRSEEKHLIICLKIGLKMQRALMRSQSTIFTNNTFR